MLTETKYFLYSRNKELNGMIFNKMKMKDKNTFVRLCFKIGKTFKETF